MRAYSKMALFWDVVISDDLSDPLPNMGLPDVHNKVVQLSRRF